MIDINEIVALHDTSAITEMELLADVVHESDRGAPWLQEGSYLWYHALGRYFRPRSILEVGTRFGYSLVAMIRGSEHVRRVTSYDLEYDFAGSIGYVESLIRDRYPSIEMDSVRVDTRTLSTLGRPSSYELGHVDGDHSEEGCHNDCALVFEALAPGGVLVVDDVGREGDQRARAGALRFIEERDLTSTFIDCYRGMFVVRKS